GLAGGGKEMTAIVELLIANQAQIGLVHERRGVERLPRLLAGQLRRGEPAQLVVDQRQQLCRGPGVALSNGVQDAGHLIHRPHRLAGSSSSKSPRELGKLSSPFASNLLSCRVGALPRRQPMIIRSAWPQCLDFFGTSLVIEPSPGQLSSDAGLLPL